MELYHQMIDYTPTKKQYSKEEIIATKLKESTNSKGDIIYSFYDFYSNQRIINSNKEEFTKEGGYIDKYIEKLKSIKNSWIIDLMEAIETYKKDGTIPENFNFLNKKG